ncbi:MAG: hypothetical protein JXJ04_16560 [Spirochaetales bacterium]|nr:hypothetical protein [Spirochaetales bacterium]
MNKKKLYFVLFFSILVSLWVYPQETPAPTQPPIEYICHVYHEGIPEGVEIRYYGDYEGKAITPFDIGPYPRPFRVVLEPTIIDIRTSDFDGMYTMGWQWADNLKPYPFSNLHMTMETRDVSPELSVIIRYLGYTSPTLEPSPGPTCMPPCPESTKAPPPFWDNVTLAGLTFSIPEYNPDEIMIGVQIDSTIARSLDWGTPSESNNVITIDTQLIEWKGPCPQKETWLYHTYDLKDLISGEDYIIKINGWGYEMGSYTFTHDDPTPTPMTPPAPPWEEYEDPNVTVQYRTINGITSAEVTLMFIEGESNLYSFYGWGTLGKSGNTFTSEPVIFQNTEAAVSEKVKYYSITYDLGPLSSGTYTFGIKPWNSDYAFIEDFVVDAEQTPPPPTPSPTPRTEPFVEVTVSTEEVVYPYEDTFTVDLVNYGGECDFSLILNTSGTRINYNISQGHLNTGETLTITGTVDWSQFSTNASYGYFTDVEVSAPGYVEDIRFYIMVNYNGPTVTPSASPTPSPTPTTDPGITPSPTPTGTPGPYQQPGDVWFVPEDTTVSIDTDFTTEVHACTGTQLFAAYGFEITFDPSILSVKNSIGMNGVDPGPDGYIAAASVPNPGILKISGFDATGTGPGLDLHILTIHWTSGQEEGTTNLLLAVDSFVAPDTGTIGYPSGKDGTVTVFIPGIGDVNGDDRVDIVDALLVAQYYVGLNPPGFNPFAGDVNCDGSVDIIDALLLAQYYVGLINDFC